MQSYPILVMLAAATAAAQTNYPYVINTIAGANPLGDQGPATAALIETPNAIALDPSGNVYISDTGNNRTRIVSGTTISTFTTGYAAGLAVDKNGNVYISDGYKQVVRYNRTGSTTLIAGGTYGFSGDGSAATAAALANPGALTFDAQGNLYIVDAGNSRVRKVNTSGIISTVAGNGNNAFAGDRGPATAASLNYPNSVAVDSTGIIYIAEEYRVRKVTADGVINTLAGSGVCCLVVQENIVPTNATLGLELGLAVDTANNIYIADTGSDRVRIVRSDGTTIRTVAGTTTGFSGDGGLATAAKLSFPYALAFDSTGNLFVSDLGNERIRRVGTDGVIATVAGRTHFDGDGGPATNAVLHWPEHAVVDARGNLYISDTDNNRIRLVTPDGNISTIAGNGTCGIAGDNGPAKSAQLCFPEAILLDPAGNLYIADGGNSRVRRIDTNGTITTVAGNGQFADVGENVTATTASLRYPWGLAMDNAGNLYFSDQYTYKIRKVTPSGIISTYAGKGTSGFSGDGGPATSAQFSFPNHLAFDSAGNLYIGDWGNERIRKVTPAGGISTIAGTVCCSAGPTATTTYIGNPGGIVVDSAGNIYFSQPSFSFISKITPSGILTPIAGNNQFTFSGDGQIATQAALNNPAGLFLDPNGDLYVADNSNSRIRKLMGNSPTKLSIVSGDAQTGDTGKPLASALVVKVLGRAGVGVPGATVTYAVTTGSATVSASSTSTDGTGVAGVSVTLGDTPGTVTVTASVAGLPPVQFTATARQAATGPPLPTISSGGIAGAGGSVPPVRALSPNGLATVYGSNFAPAGTAQSVGGSDLVGGFLPTNFASTCVEVAGIKAPIIAVYSTQINFQTPSVTTGTNSPVVVIANCGSSNELRSAPQSVAAQAATPEFLYWVQNANGKNPIIALNAVSGGYVGASGLITGLTFTPAKPGDILTIYGIGFGATSPAFAPGEAPSVIGPTVATPSVTLGTTTLSASDVLYAGVSPGTAGLYQLNIRVPNLAAADYPIMLTLGSVSSPAGAYLTIGQ